LRGVGRPIWHNCRKSGRKVKKKGRGGRARLQNVDDS
jgi:hypothetical protein